MIEFLLVVYLGGTLIDQTQRFQDLERCIFFAETLSAQPAIPTKKGKRDRILAVCKPIPKVQ